MRGLLFCLLFSLGASAQKSYTLAECIDLARQHHPDVALQNLIISRAQNTLEQSLKSRLPTVSGSVSSGLNGGRSIDPFSNGFVQRTISYNSFNVSTGWVLFNGFSLRNQIEKNRENKITEEWQMEVVRKDMALAVTEAYANAVINRELIRLQQESLQDLLNQAASVKEQIKEGVMASYALTEAEAHLANARFELIQVENNYLLAKKMLAQLMMTNEDFEVLVPQVTLPPLVPRAGGLHPALRVWDRRIRAAQIGVAMARAERYPRLSVNLGLGTSYSSGAVSEFSYLQQLSYNFNQFAGLSLSMPLLFGQAGTRINAAKVEEKIVHTQRKKTELQLTQQAEALKLELTTLEKKLQSAETNANAQTLLYEGAKEKFKEGLVNQLELNTYRLNMEKSKIQFTQTRYEIYFKYLALKEFMN